MMRTVKTRRILLAVALLLLLTTLLTACGSSTKKDKADRDILVTQIVLLGDEIQVKADGSHYVIADAETDGTWRYQIKYRTYPENATDHDVDFTLLTANPYATIDEDTHTVTLTKEGVATVLLKGRGQSEATITLEIWAR